MIKHKVKTLTNSSSVNRNANAAAAAQEKRNENEFDLKLSGEFTFKNEMQPAIQIGSSFPDFPSPKKASCVSPRHSNIRITGDEYSIQKMQ